MSYTLIIGTRNWSSWSLRAWLALKSTGIAFEEVLIRLRQADSASRIRKLSPSARVPLLLISEGDNEYKVFDSLAICETIAERHPEAGLWPDDPEARSLARSYTAEMHAGFLALREALPMDFARILPQPHLDDTVLEQIERIQSAWEYSRSRHKGQGDFLFGRFSITDCMYAPVVSRFLTYEIPLSDEVQQYATRIMELPAMQEWFEGSKMEIDAGLPDQWVVEMVRNVR